MKFFSDKKNIAFSATVFVLLCTLAVSGFFLTRKSSDYKKTSAALSQNEDALSKIQSDVSEYSSKLESFSSQLEEKKKQREALESELQKERAERERLEKENAGLKAQLLAKRRAEEQERLRLAIQNCQQAGAPPGGKIAYLTFDDGPSDNTLKILDILASYNIKATFFVVGNSKKLDYIKRAHAEGHTIALHSDTHQYSSIYSSVENYLADLNAVSNKVEALIGVKSMLLRFPGGGSNRVSAGYCKGIMSDLTVRVRSMGYSYFDWNVSSGDAASVKYSPAQICANVLNASKNKQSVCVLMHDTEAKSNTVQALIPMIEGLHNQGFTFAPLTVQSFGYYQTVFN